jgi:flavin reductase (DIM6/NTAB) family NADH-FMN oxidoreductase RutF
MNAIGKLDFRKVLSSYPTGVAIVTCRDGAGQPAALTINSFASLSLTPPLVLWSIEKNSDQFDAFAQATHYAVNILAEGHGELARHFATHRGDKFDGIDHYHGIQKLPLLPDCCASLQCRIVDRVEAGDHIVMIGEVIEMDKGNASPLVFHQGQYRALA